MNNDYIVFYDNKYKFDDDFVYNFAKSILDPCPDSDYHPIDNLNNIFSTASTEISNTYGDNRSITKEMFSEIIYNEVYACIKEWLFKYMLESNGGTNDFYARVYNHSLSTLSNLFFNSLFDIDFAMNYNTSDIDYSYWNLTIGNHDDVNTMLFTSLTPGGTRKFFDRLNENYK